MFFLFFFNFDLMITTVSPYLSHETYGDFSYVDTIFMLLETSFPSLSCYC